MAGDLSEKPDAQAHTRASSNGGGSSSESNISATVKAEGQSVEKLEHRGTVDRLGSRDSKVEVPEKEDEPFKHLPAHEAEILKRQVFVPEVKVGYQTLYRYATTWDLIIVAISALCSIVAGAVLPLMTVKSTANLIGD